MGEFYCSYKGVRGDPGYILLLHKVSKSEDPQAEIEALSRFEILRDFAGRLKSHLEQIVGCEDESFEVGLSLQTRRVSVSRHNFEETAAEYLKDYFEGVVVAYCREYGFPEGRLLSVAVSGVTPIPMIGEDEVKSEDDPRCQTRPAAEAIKMYPDHSEFNVFYTISLNVDGLRAWDKAREEGYREKSGRQMNDIIMAARHV